MKNPIGSIALLFSITLATGLLWQIAKTDSTTTVPTVSSSTATTGPTASTALCPRPTRVIDSLALVDLYNSTNGFAWCGMSVWVLFDPVCTWDRVTIDADGYVTHLNLGNSCLVGTLPNSLGNMERMVDFKVDNNDLTGSLPSSMGNWSDLQVLFVDNNAFNGSIPNSFGNLTNLISFFLDNNNFTGPIPGDFVNLVNLQRFEMFVNKIDSLPDLSSLTLLANRFRVEENALTFDDILPNLGTAMGDFYHPQCDICPFSLVNISTGDDFAIDLGIDHAINDNVYTWSKDGSFLVTLVGNNQLDLTPITFDDAGQYTCQIRNPRAPLLTIQTCQMNVQVGCGLSVNDIRDSLCFNETIQINSTTYSRNNPTDTIFLGGATPDGCDSAIYINLTFPPGEAIGELRDTICPGDTIFVNGTAYHGGRLNGFEFFPNGSVGFECDSLLNIFLRLHPESDVGAVNPTVCPSDTFTFHGREFFAGQESGLVVLPTTTDVNGCDSTVRVTLGFFPRSESVFDQTLCLDDSITINGTIYHQGNPSGRDTLANASQFACDSFIVVDLNFEAFATGDFRPTLCPGDSVTVNGTVYNAANPNGMETFLPSGPGDCDSIVTVVLSFHPLAERRIDTLLCPGDELVINGIPINLSNPIDTILLPDGSVNGCDSTVFAQVAYHPVVERTFDPDLCLGDTVFVNGTAYHEGNRTGTEIFTGATVNGCDSTVFVDLQYLPEATGNFNPIICPEDTVFYNGTAYHAANPTGTERVLGVAPQGCDSIVSVTISFFPLAEGSQTLEICTDECVLYEGQEYCSTDVGGLQVLENASVNGCDSLVMVAITVLPLASSDFNPILCPGDSIEVNGTFYHDLNRMGTERLDNLADNGCDSIVRVAISFFDTVRFDLTGTLCFGEAIMVNGTEYNELNRQGLETLEGAADNGCDSLVYIDLDFTSFASAEFKNTLCFDDSLELNNIVYDRDNPVGRDTIVGGSASGCDSIIIVDLDFFAEAVRTIDTTLCSGEELLVNGVIYDETNTSGTEILLGRGQGNCDSTVHIEVDYFPEASRSIDTTLCFGGSLLVNGTIYDAANPVGLETLNGLAASGCDSTVDVRLLFYDPALNEVTQGICPGQAITINGVVYDQDNPTGRDTIFGAGQFGCDSLIAVDLTVSGLLTGTLDGTYCRDVRFEINGNIYDIGNPSGSEMLLSTGGCDSLVTIDLDFFAVAKGDLNPEVCAGGSFEFNGTVYDATNPMGSETLPGASVNGCDSIVEVQLNFDPILTGRLEGTWCADTSFTINGTVYDADRPSGSEVIRTPEGCDSLLTIALDFFPAAADTLDDIWCANRTVVINGREYGFDNPMGTEVLENASANGCDSTVRIDLQFFAPAVATVDTTICPGEVLEFEGEQYRETGSFDVDIKQPSVNGCDSMLTLNLLVLDDSVLVPADAGDDREACTAEAPLTANLPAGTSGQWTGLDDLQVLDPGAANTTVEGLRTGENLLIWTLSTERCPDYDADTLALRLEGLPLLTDDDFIHPFDATFSDLDILANDDYDPSLNWSVQLENLPTVGDFSINSDNTVRFTPPNDVFTGTLEFSYFLCSVDCPDRCAEALVRLVVEDGPATIDTTVNIPSGITPNGDGLNDVFIIDLLVTNPDEFPDNELVIFNRWGDIVYQASPYLNDWTGTNQGGEALPQGTYYYVLRLNIQDGLIFKGDVTILK
ncbi:MAG: gliding motility-associated C-terminal domain-containing protein [Bacteroidota bacterium]